MVEVKKKDLLFYSCEGIIQIGIVTDVAPDGWATVINNCTKRAVSPHNFVDTQSDVSDMIRKSLATFK